MKYVLILCLIFALGWGALFIVERRGNSQTIGEEILQDPDSVIEYISRNIATLSPEPATMGGTFYVTNITLDSGSGTVEYEDGHHAYVANFTYEYQPSGEVHMQTFELLEQE